MSGEPPFVELAASGDTERLVAALARLTEGGPRFALVGGVAVVARLAEVHRATSDLDAVSDDTHFLEAVLALPTAAFAHGELTIDGVKIDTIPVEIVDWSAIAAVEGPLDRLFAAGHLWAMQNASPLRLRAGTASALVRVASPSGLLATKLHAFCSSRRDARKRGSDAWDVFRLGELVVRSQQPPFAGAPPVVIDAVRWAVQQHWAADPSSFVRRLRELGVERPDVTENQVQALADLLLEFLNPRVY